MPDTAARLAGHTLFREGQPYTLTGSEWAEVRSSWSGRARCSCGAYSGVLESNNARKRWHRAHKDEIRGHAPAVHAFTRDSLVNALTRLETHVLTSGPGAWKINAESMADAIIEALGDPRRDPIERIAARVEAEVAPAGGEDRVPDIPADPELLEAAARALRSFALRSLTVKPTLEQPYRDDPRWSPWTRWIEPEARRAHDLSCTIRKRLAADGIRVNGPDGAFPGLWPELPAEETARAAVIRLLEEALHLRRNGEYAPGGGENWRDWEQKTEAYLRHLHI